MQDGNVRVALVGCGEVARFKHIPALERLPGAELVLLVDPDPTALAALGTAAPGARRSTEVEAALASGIDAVGVLVPPEAHARVAVPLLAAGKAVLVEKPIALTLEDANALVVAGRTPGARGVMGFHMRHHRLVQQARELIRAGAVGPVESIRTTWYSPRRLEGMPAWKRARATGGGTLIELAVHHFDLWRFLLDAEAERIVAFSRSGATEDETAIVSARLSGGVLASAQFSERTSHQIEIEVCGSRGRLCISCLRFEGLDLVSLTDTPGGGKSRLRRLLHFLREFPAGLATSLRGGDYLDSYRRQWEAFLIVARGEAPPSPTLDDGMHALRMVVGALDSAARGDPVELRA